MDGVRIYFALLVKLQFVLLLKPAMHASRIRAGWNIVANGILLHRARCQSRQGDAAYLCQTHNMCNKIFVR